MRIVSTLILLAIVLASHAQTQKRIISGRLTDADGSPLPGVNIVIKGTTTGTTTDTDGRYSIKVPVGSTLVFSSIGMRTREVVVTAETPVTSNTRRKEQPDTRPRPTSAASPDALLNLDSIQNKKGVAVLTDETPRYVKTSALIYNRKTGLPPAETSRIYPYEVGSIHFINKRVATKRFGSFGTYGLYVIDSDNNSFAKFRPSILFSVYTGSEEVNKLPQLQHTYAQGRPSGGGFIWQGSDQQEIFSWGPRIQNLEFDGSVYPYDKNGRLVPKGTGSGIPATFYDPLKFFRRGRTTSYNLELSIPLQSNSNLIASASHHTEQGILPGSSFMKNNVGIRLRDLKVRNNLRTGAFVSYVESTGNLIGRGGNLAAVMGSVLRTPRTFDNANGFNSGKALNNPEAYQLGDGSQRSHAAGLVDNPYWLVNNLPDNERLDRFISYLRFNYEPSGKISISFSGNFDKQSNHVIHGMPVYSAAYPEGRYTDRDEESQVFNTIITPQYDAYIGRSRIKASISHQFSGSQRNLYRQDGFGFNENNYGQLASASRLISLHEKANRVIHEIVTSADYEYRNLFIVKFTNRNYFSNTIDRAAYTNFLPTASARINLDDIFYNTWYVSFINSFSIYSNYSTSLREAPLIYSDWAYNSVNTDEKDYTGYYESGEIFFEKGLLPEKDKKIEAGIMSTFFNGRLALDYSHYHSVTDNFLAPVYEGSNGTLSNMAQVTNSGNELSASYLGGNSLRWGVEVKWSQVKPLVSEVYSKEVIPLAGFTSANAVLAEGKPLGALYGTTYLRNENGQRIIGDDGFPLVNQTLSMIGNPNPDWILGWSGFLSWKGLEFHFLIDIKYGGDVWNGTRQVLNYLGQSELTARERQISGYIFDGVNAEGLPNNVLVDFANPAKPVEENRWVRYGWEGVGEDAVENGSAIRLSEIKLVYNLTPLFRPRMRGKDIEFSLIGKNLFLITPNSGVDPASSLFGYNLGAGLDLFNVPATRSYGAQLTIKL